MIYVSYTQTYCRDGDAHHDIQRSSVLHFRLRNLNGESYCARSIHVNMQAIRLMEMYNLRAGLQWATRLVHLEIISICIAHS